MSTVEVRTVAKGATVSLNAAELSDWCYSITGKADGAFTDPRMRSVITHK